MYYEPVPPDIQEYMEAFIQECKQNPCKYCINRTCGDCNNYNDGAFDTEAMEE